MLQVILLPAFFWLFVLLLPIQQTHCYHVKTKICSCIYFSYTPEMADIPFARVPQTLDTNVVVYTYISLCITLRNHFIYQIALWNHFMYMKVSRNS